MKNLFERKITAMNIVLPLAMTLVCTIGLYDLSVAQENNRNATLTSDNRSQDMEGPDLCAPESGEGFYEGKAGDVPALLANANFLEMGAPAGGYPTVTSLQTFNSKLFLATSSSPLGNWGTNVFSTTDGISYTKVLEDATSQGYLRIRSFDGKLWIPDGDPNGLDPSFVYTSSTGASGSFAQGTVLLAVHTFDVIKYNNQLYCSNGMSSGQGGICKFDGSTQWTSVYANSNSMRMKYMAAVNGNLVVANRLSSSDVDCFVWSGDVATTTPVQVNALSGSTNTFRLFTSSTGKIFWSLAATQARVLVSSDGLTWQNATTLNGRVVADFAELNGKLYALASDGLWESSDYFTFQKVAPAPPADTTAFMLAPAGSGLNPDGAASMEVFNGSLWCGSSRNGKIYKVDFATSVPESAAASTPYEVTDHSVIFHLENNSPVELRVYSLEGSLVESFSSGTVSAGKYEIDLGKLKNGFYLLEARIGNEVKGIKFVRR